MNNTIKFKLLDYEAKEFEVEVEKDSTIVVEVISGDQVMTSPFYFDTSNNRCTDYYDGEVEFKATKENAEKLKLMKGSYDIFSLGFKQ